MDPLNEILTKQTRRTFLERGTLALGAMALGSLLKAGLSWVFMFKHDHLPGFLQGYELNGFAYASTVGYSVQLGLLLYIVFHLRRHHAQYWRGWCAQHLLLIYF